MALLALPLLVPAAIDVEQAEAAYRQKDFETAFAGFMPLARQGDARSQTIIAIMYRYGEGVDADPATAYQWYLRAAHQGYGPAQYQVADMLIGGEGVTADPQAGLAWMKRAAGAGYNPAEDYVEPAQEDISWSRNWKLQLPDNIRLSPTDATPAFRAQLGSGSSLAQVERFWQLLLTEFPDVLEDLQPNYRRDVFADEASYQLQVGQFRSATAATEFCRKLRPRPCAVVYR